MPQSPYELRSAFLSQLRPATRVSYARDLDDLEKFLGRDAFRLFLSSEPGAVNLALMNYKSELLLRGLSPSTINRRFSTMRSLNNFLRTIGAINYSLTVKSERAATYRDTTGLAADKVSELFSIALSNSHTASAARDMAILRLMLDLGLRVEEVTKLNHPEDLKLDLRQITVRGKGRYEAQYMTLPEATVDTLEKWLEKRGFERGALFYNMRDAKRRRITTRGVHHVISGLGRKLGQELHPHKLRHTAITEACKQASQNEIAIEEVLDFSRHKDLRTLLIYRDRERDVQGMLSELVSKKSFKA